MGGSNTYFCERCPLIFELGGHTAFDGRRVISDMTMLVCGACGTMHQLTEKPGHPCQVSAFAGPVRATRTVTVPDVCGDPVESTEWATDHAWEEVGPHAGGIKDLAGFPCRHCGRAGRMVSLEMLNYPGGYVRGAERQEFCPVCGDPLFLMAISDTI